MNTSSDQIAAQLIRACHHAADLSNMPLDRASARHGLHATLVKALRLVERMQDGPDGGNVVSLHPLSAGLAQRRS